MMKMSGYVLILSVFAASVSGQERTVFSGDVEHSGFGGPVVKFSRIDEQNVLLVGGRGGWILNHTLAIGGGGYGVVTELDAPIGSLGVWDSPMDIEFGYGGVEIEYILNSNALAHYSVYALIGGGATNFVKDAGKVTNSNEQVGETDYLFVIEPAINGEFNIAPWFRLNAGVSWRLVSGVEKEYLDNGDYSGPAANITFKFGKF